jgi:hypothetical protein
MSVLDQTTLERHSTRKFLPLPAPRAAVVSLGGFFGTTAFAIWLTTIKPTREVPKPLP